VDSWIACALLVRSCFYEEWGKFSSISRSKEKEERALPFLRYVLSSIHEFVRISHHLSARVRAWARIRLAFSLLIGLCDLERLFFPDVVWALAPTVGASLVDAA